MRHRRVLPEPEREKRAPRGVLTGWRHQNVQIGQTSQSGRGTAAAFPVTPYDLFSRETRDQVFPNFKNTIVSIDAGRRDRSHAQNVLGMIH